MTQPSPSAVTPPASDGPVTDGTPAGLVPPGWPVPDIFRRRLGDSAGRQRAMVADGHLLLVLHAPPRDDEPERHGRLFWMDPYGHWQAAGATDGHEALRRHMDEYQTLLDQLEEQENRAQTAAEYFAVLNVITGLYRAARNQQLALQDARQQLTDSRDLINFRDRAYELERAADLLHQDARNALDFRIAKQAEEQARASYQMAVSSHRLNLLVAFFFPVATLSAVFGMSLRSGLEDLPPPLPWITILLTGLLCGVLLKSLIGHAPRR